MKTLGKSSLGVGMKLEARKREGIVCVSKREGSPTLAITDGDGKRWIMPWAHLLHANYTCEAGEHRIELVYVTHEVICEGTCLESLAEGLAKFAVEWVRCYDKRYLELCPEGRPFLNRIEVSVKTE